MLDVVKVNLDRDDSRTQMNDIDDEGYTALHYAARYNRLAVVEVLVKAGAGLCRQMALINTVLFMLFGVYNDSALLHAHSVHAIDLLVAVRSLPLSAELHFLVADFR